MSAVEETHEERSSATDTIAGLLAVASIFLSPVCRMVPDAVRMISDWDSGI